MPNTKLIIVDVDDTLFDWLGMWSESFETFVSVLATRSTLPGDKLIAELRRLHVSARTSERGFVRDDGEVLGVDPQALEELAHKFEQDLRSRTRLFPGVMETLTQLRDAGVSVVAHTDTPVNIAAERFVELGLDGVVDALFATTGKAATIHRLAVRQLQVAQLTEVSCPKPSPDALLQILEACDVAARETMYVGDSKMKDIPMARAVGVKDVFAAYGCRRTSSAYELLRSVSHWTDEDIARERALLKVEPTHSLERFEDVLDLL